MIHAIPTKSLLASLLVAAIFVLQFSAVQHSIEHGGTLPDIGCDFCVSGAASASLTTHPAVPHPAPSFAEPPLYAPAPSTPASRRALPPARGPPTLA
ncbi:MAG: hypothetical protein WD081_10300 [Gammaproteobacteria bacterium]